MILEVRNISLSFDGREVLKEVSLGVKEGQIVSIVGKSGAGKTSLLKIMAGNEEPDSGQIFFEGKLVKGPLSKLIPGHEEICLVNQDFKLDLYHTAEENIRLQILNLKDHIRDKFVDELIDLMDLQDQRKQQARSLSGGEQQRLAIARVLAREPKIILLDEPFSHLDALLRSRLTQYFLELRRLRGTAFVLVSHDGTEVLGLSDCIYSMKNGILTKKGDPLKVYYKASTLDEARMFGPINSVRLGEKRITFRPDEYSIEKGDHDKKVKVEFLDSSFTGAVFENHFVTSNREKVVLYSFNRMNDVHSFWIRKKDLKTHS